MMPIRSPGDTADHSSIAGANDLAERLTAYWIAHGYPSAQFRTENGISLGKDGGRLVDVRSNLVNGLPPGPRGQSPIT